MSKGPGAGSIAQRAVDLLYSIANHRPGGLRIPVHRTGWAGLGWAGWLAGWAGLQRDDLRSADFFHALRPRPSGLWDRSQSGRREKMASDSDED